MLKKYAGNLLDLRKIPAASDSLSPSRNHFSAVDDTTVSPPSEKMSPELVLVQPGAGDVSRKSIRLYCFSPPVMLVTLIIEFGLAIYTIWRYKMTTVSRLAVAILITLGSFQLAEYMICGGLGLTHMDWARFGYISITLLPALGIHMIVVLAGQKKTWLVGAVYTTCAAFVVYYLFNIDAISSQGCYANYAVFHSEHIGSLLYTAYYYGWLMTGVYLSWLWGSKNHRKRVALYAMMFGYLVFIVPTTYFNIIDPTTVRGIPSIMCGFAVLFAVVIVVKVLPNSAEPHGTVKKDITKKLRAKIPKK